MASQEQVVNELNTEISSIKDNLKKSGLSEIAFKALSENAKLLQDKLDNVINKGSKKDIDDAYTALQDVRRNEFRKMSRRVVIRVVVGLSVVVLAFVLINKYTKKK